MIDAKHIMKYIDEYVTPIELLSDEEIDMAQQTAVEWLIDKLSNIKAEDVNSTLEVRLICQQAKAMEKEQLNIARLDGINLANKGYGK